MRQKSITTLITFAFLIFGCRGREQTSVPPANLALDKPTEKSAPASISRGTISRSQAEAIRLIEGLGGDVVYDFEQFDGANIPQNHPKLREIQILDGSSSTQIIFVQLRSEGVQNKDLRILNQFRYLKGLHISSKQVSDEGLNYLTRLTQLEKLWLVGTGIRGPGLRHLKFLQNLKLLNLGGTLISDQALATFPPLANLDYLIINSEQITNHGLAYLQKLKRLRYLSIDGTSTTGAGLKYLSMFPELESLSIDRRHLSEEGLTYIKKARQLHQLWVQDLMITPDQEAELRRDRPDLSINKWHVQP